MANKNYDVIMSSYSTAVNMYRRVWMKGTRNKYKTVFE